GACVIVGAPAFADAFQAQALDRYLGIVAASGHTLFDRETPPGAEPEELLAMKVPALIIPGDDPAHAASSAYYLREMLPQPELWPVMPPEQTAERVRDRILEFGRAHRGGLRLLLPGLQTSALHFMLPTSRKGGRGRCSR